MSARDGSAHALFALMATVICAGLASLVIGAETAFAATPTGARIITLYSIPVDLQYRNDSDDRARGEGNNPFGNFRGTGTATDNERLGPFPGDEGLFSYDLYVSPTLKKRAGSAVIVCQYNFDRDGLCNAWYQLDGGSLVGVGQLSSAATKSLALVITGGTGTYRGAKGILNLLYDHIVPPQIPAATYQVPDLVFESQRLVFGVRHLRLASAPASPALQRLTFYSVPTEEQFLDHADDEARGWEANPFGLRDARAQRIENQDKGGPYPGDVAIFGFNLYSKQDVNIRVGSGLYTCYYVFQQKAICEASFKLPRGSLFAVGEFAFNSADQALAITSGTGQYASISGDAEQSPGGRPATELLSFLIQPD